MGEALVPWGFRSRAGRPCHEGVSEHGRDARDRRGVLGRDVVAVMVTAMGAQPCSTRITGGTPVLRDRFRSTGVSPVIAAMPGGETPSLR